MKKFIKIMLIIILLLVIINMCILPNIVKAEDDASLDSIGDQIESDVAHSKEMANDFMDNVNTSTLTIIGATSWIVSAFWIGFIIAAVIGAWVCVLPVIKGIIFGTGAAGAWKAFVIYLLIFFGALLILLWLIPLVVEWM